MQQSWWPLAPSLCGRDRPFDLVACDLRASNRQNRLPGRQTISSNPVDPKAKSW
jgi:hypothetical protein